MSADVIADRPADAPAAWIQLRRVSLFIAHLLVDKYNVSGFYTVVFQSGFPLWVSQTCPVYTNTPPRGPARSGRSGRGLAC